MESAQSPRPLGRISEVDIMPQTNDGLYVDLTCPPERLCAAAVCRDTQVYPQAQF